MVICSCGSLSKTDSFLLNRSALQTGWHHFQWISRRRPQNQNATYTAGEKEPKVLKLLRHVAQKGLILLFSSLANSKASMPSNWVLLRSHQTELPFPAMQCSRKCGVWTSWCLRGHACGVGNRTRCAPTFPWARTPPTGKCVGTSTIATHAAAETLDMSLKLSREED